MEPPPKHRSWRISVRAKSKDLDLRVSASNIVLPDSGKGAGERISLILRLWRVFLNLEVKSENRGPVGRGIARSRSALFRFFGKIYRQGFHRKNRSASDKRWQLRNPRISFPHNGGHSSFQGPMASMMGSLSLLSHSAYDKDHEGIIIHAFTFFFYVLLLLKMRKTQLSLLLVTATVSLIGISLCYLSYTDLVPKAVWKAWTRFSSLGCFSALCQVICSRISLRIERNRKIWLLILASLSFFLLELIRVFLIKCVKIIIEGNPVLIPNLLLTCQGFFHMLSEPGDPKGLGIYASTLYFWGKNLIKILASYIAERSP